ncbi:SRPBCC family protein [Terricaulis silvestris]|uniref:Polyketide cyclase / dehydrase and lipid transport n=1 Tax=Terricaulis silvestris TaxID=2686094 RepID=A0A6I6MQS1_9CAUL|nr:SRPBCC family protein [Terricaulis silvestris]QGZ95746.1 Polyketide cyclase / dehydrase and lipid transport [Terricaulis silvestris]
MASTEQREPTASLNPQRKAIVIAIGLAAGILFVLGPYGMRWLMSAASGNAAPSFTSASGFTTGLVLLFPLVQGLAMGLAIGRGKHDFGETAILIVILTGIELVAAFVLLREGVICLIILSPLIFVMVAAGAFLGRVIVRATPKRSLQVSLIPLIALAVFAEASGPKPDYSGSVADSVTINAPPEYVWRYVVQYPENETPSEYWLWNVGLPRPIQSVAETPEVGGTRLCRFSDGIVFEERITELVPNQVMTFDVTRQPNHPEVIGHFQFDRGQIRLTPNANGTTTITATSWYRLFVRPAPYFDWWTADITRNIHFRVLNHMKRLAEQDYARDQAAGAAPL